VLCGNEYLGRIGVWGKATLHHTPDTSKLPFTSASMDLVIANAVFEHIPQPRDAYLRECWRLLRPGGHLIINETPNKYVPLEMHTTKLWFNHWLPSSWAFARAKRRGRYKGDWAKWPSSGWRGCGYWELRRCLPGATLVPEKSRLRHRVLTRLGLPASLIDPYPCWVWRKTHD
jgi:SAM-dependent methyltransferase